MRQVPAITPARPQSGHPLALERYDHDQTSSQKFNCCLDPGWCHPRCHCSDTDAADADHQDSGRRHFRPWHGHVAGSTHFADRSSRDRAALPRWQDRPVVFVGEYAAEMVLMAATTGEEADLERATAQMERGSTRITRVDPNDTTLTSIFCLAAVSPSE
jgi:hypothetical protein